MGLLDPDVPGREADTSSVSRHGPWARFSQRWTVASAGEPKAVNCLTGAYGETAHAASSQMAFDELEHAQQTDDRLVLGQNEADVLATYTRHMAKQMSNFEFELKFLRVRRRAQALTLID